MPVPLQVRAEVNVEPVQLAATHCVPAPYSLQPPPPLHVPSVPQVAAVWSAHWSRGSCPAGTEAQVPTEPVRLHDTHVPEQAVEQQTPCAQKPELHMVPEVHGDVMGSLPQLMLTQLLGDEQSALLAQGIVLQVGVVVLQT